jgi:hypothetical protein
LYWNLVQELVKIVADDDRRVPSIRNLRRHLEDRQVKAAFQTKYSAWGSPAKKSDAPDVRQFWEHRALRREQEGKQTFDLLYDKAMKESTDLLNSHALAGMKEVRDKLLAHNELKPQNGSYQFIDIKNYGLKYGDERVLLEMATRVFDDFFALVKGAPFEWDRSKDLMEHDAKLFWRE